MEFNMTEFTKFVESRRLDDTIKHNANFVCLGGLTKCGKFYFYDEEIETFYNYINKAAEAGKYLSFAEIVPDVAPLYVDLDFEALYDDRMILKKKNLSTYIDKIKKEFEKQINENYNIKNIDVTIFKKNKVFNKGDYYKSGAHLIFNNVIMTREDRINISNEVFKKCEDMGLFENFSNIDVIDVEVLKSKPWLLYGCCKPGNIPYIDIDNDEFEVNKYSLSHKKYRKTPKKEKQPEKDIYTSLPEKTEIKNIDYNIENISNIVKMLSYERSHAYNSWIRVGWALHNINKDDEELLNIWIEFSKKSSKYKTGECAKYWGNMKTNNKGVSIGSLLHWAKNDNPDEFYKYNKVNNNYVTKKNNNYVDLFFKQLELSSNNFFAQKFIEFFNNDKYIYCSENNCWYEYDENNILINHGIGKHNYPLSLSQNITEICQEKLTDVYHKVLPDDPVRFKAYSNIYKKNYRSLGSTSYKKDIIEELKIYYNNKDLLNKLDKNNNIFAFNDKCFDFSIGEFRNIEKSDFVSITTGYKAPTESNKKINKHIMDILKSIFNTDELINFVIETLGFSLFTNKFEKMYIWSGSGGNGKGLLMSIIQCALGNHFYIPDSQFLTTKYKAGATNSSLYNTNNKKIVMVSEPEGDDKGELQFNLEFVKKITGRDRITVRDLYVSNITFDANFSLFVQCNDKPKLDRVDNAVKRRIIDINFPNQFVENPKFDNERLIDYSLKSKFTDETYYKEFILILINYIKDKFNNEKLNIPDCVMESTNEYIEENNVVGRFIAEHLEVTQNPKDKVNSKILFDLYKTNGYDKTTSSKFKANLLSNKIRNKRMTSGIVYIGIKIKEKEEPDFDDNDDVTEALELDI